MQSPPPSQFGTAAPSAGSADQRSRRRGVVSIKDVANAANVSIATVSRVLNNPSLVAPSTAERVQRAVKELGYRPNLFAKGLMTRRSRVIGVSLPDWQGDSYSDLMRGADARARELGYHLLVSSDAHHGAPDDAGAPSFALDLVDGFIAMVTRSGGHDPELLEQLDMPVVILTSSGESSGLDQLELDNASGAARATRHLLEGTPADRCYFVGGPEGNIDSDRRAESFRSQLASAGHEPRPDQINRGTFSFVWGWEWAGRLVESNAASGAAILAGNDEIAIGVMQRVQEAGLEVPRDVRIVGFDDSRTCGLLTPPLSSVRVPNRQIGAEAINTLVRRLNEPSLPPVHAKLRTTLVIRESSQY